MAKEQVIPQDIFNDAYEKCAMGIARINYIQGRLDERAKGNWTDEDIEHAFNCLPFHVKFAEWLEEYKKTKDEARKDKE